MRLEDRITVTPGIRSGKPCIKGTRIAVYDVLEYLAGGMSEADILSDFPTLTSDDIRSLPRLRRRAGAASRLVRRGVRLLFDENLSPRLVARCAATFPDCRHVDHVGLHGRSDREIWDHARAHGYTIVSKDNDFRQLSFLYGAPPKVIWLSVGNAGTDVIADLLERRAAEIVQLTRSADESLLVIELPTG